MTFKSEKDFLRHQIKALRSTQRNILKVYKEDVAKLVKVEDENEYLRSEISRLKKELKNAQIF